MNCDHKGCDCHEMQMKENLTGKAKTLIAGMDFLDRCRVNHVRLISFLESHFQCSTKLVNAQLKNIKSL